MSTHYDVLNVHRRATPDAIRYAYRREAMRWHPDRVGRRVEEATQRFHRIEEAYRVLSDRRLRARYDRQLAREPWHEEEAAWLQPGRDRRRRRPPRRKPPVTRIPSGWRGTVHRTMHAGDGVVDRALGATRRRIESLPMGRYLSRGIRRGLYQTPMPILLALVVVLAAAIGWTFVDRLPWLASLATFTTSVPSAARVE